MDKGQPLFNIYCQSCNNTNYENKSIPNWEMLPEKIRYYWNILWDLMWHLSSLYDISLTGLDTYNMYRILCNNKTYDDKDMPFWNQLPIKVQKNWDLVTDYFNDCYVNED